MEQQHNDSIKITVKDFVLRYIRYLPLFIISLMITLLLSYLYIRYATPFYNVKATLLIKSNDNNPGGGDDVFNSMFMFKGKDDVGNEIEILKSLTLAKRTALSLGLQVRYYSIGNIKTSLLYSAHPFNLEVLKVTDSVNSVAFKVKLLDKDRFTLNEKEQVYAFNQNIQLPEGLFRFVKTDSVFSRLNYKDYQVSWDPLEVAGQRLLSELAVAQIKDRSNILILSMQTIQPEMGAAILNRLMEEYQNSSVEDKNQIASRTIRFINDRLSILTNELGDVEKNLQQFKEKNQVINLGAQSELYLNNASDIDKQLTEKEVKIGIIRYLKEYIEDNKNNYTLVPSSLGLDEPTLMQLVREYNELQLRRDGQLKTTTLNNPSIKLIDSQLEKVRLNMLENLHNLELTSIMVRDNLKQKTAQFKQSTNAIPLKEKELLEISRQQGIKQSLYLYLLQKREETAITLASTISNSQVVDPAITSKYPITPNRINIRVLALFLGLLIPLVFIYLRELLNDKVNTRNDIHKITDMPMIGEIGHSEKSETLVVKENSRNVLAEQFRLIRTNLQYLIGKIDKPVILVTSTFSGEGKSFASVNIGAVMALTGKKTVILEFDIRKPKIVTSLKLQKKPGISNYIVGNVRMDEMLTLVPGTDNLFVIGCGPIPPNPAEMLLDEKLDQFFRELKMRFDVVVMDTAPSGLVSDAFQLGRFADCSLYIVRFNYTYKKQVVFIDEVYRNKKLPNAGILVNDIKTNSHYYSYGNYSGYGYGYAHGYTDDENKFSSNRWVRGIQKIGASIKSLFT